MRVQQVLLLCFLMTILGCATEAQKNDDIADAWKLTLPEVGADYGSYPTNYEKIIKSYLSKTLKDPDSARYSDFSTPRKEHAIANVNKQQAIYGYSVCANVNAKNSFGGYTGSHLFWFFIRNGEIVRSKDTTKTFGKIIYRGRGVDCSDGDGNGYY